MLAPTTSPAEVIGRVDALTAPLDDRLWAAAGNVELIQTVEALAEHEARLAAIRAQALDEIAARDLPRRTLHWASAGDWYAHTAGLTRRGGHRAIRHGQMLLDERDATLRALAEAQVSEIQAGAICDAVDKLPTNPALREQAETLLIDEAGRLDATQLAQAGAHILTHLDPDHDERKAEADLAREERAAHLGRDHGDRMWDALLGIAHHSLDTDAQPESHGTRPRLSVLIDWNNLRDDVEGAHAAGAETSAVTEDGLTLSHAAVRRLACDADIIPIVLGTTGEVLDVGRRHRLVTMALWLALIARDRHCTFPGCTRPPVMCHAHHIRHWADGGGTALNNLVMLCGHHHRTIHDTPWNVRLATDGRPEFQPPPRRGQDPPDSWSRHRPRRE